MPKTKSSGVNSKARVPQKYTLSCAVKESHGHPIYCVAFSRHVHMMDDGHTTAACFATCAGPYATIYEVCNNGGEQPLRARQVYRDNDDGEIFNTCAFGGRGVGSPVGYSPTLVAKEENGNIIHFGDHQKKKHHDSKKPAKRQKQSESHDAYQSHCQFFLPYSATQNGPPLLCLAGARGIIKVIDTYRRSLFITLSGHGNDITDLKFSPANEWLLLSASKDETIRLWNLQRGVNVAVFTGHNGHRGQVLSVSWHLSGTKFASCGMDNLVKLWNVYDSEKKDKSRSVEEALKKSYSVVPDACGVENGTHINFETIFHQFPYFSTNKAHTNYVGKIQTVL